MVEDRKVEMEERQPQIGDPGYTLDDLAMRPEDYRRLGIETPEEREKWKALPKFGDPGCTIDDLALKPEDYKEAPQQRPRQTIDWNRPWRKRLSERQFSGNVIDLEKVRDGTSRPR